MYILRVIPLDRYLPGGELSYFCPTSVPIGDLVTVTIKKSQVLAMVLGTEKVTDAKSTLKRASFPLKRITRHIGTPPFHPSLVPALVLAASFFGRPASMVIPAFFSAPDIALLEKGLGIARSKKETTAKDFNTTLVQGSEQKRLGIYKKMIDGTLAKNESVVVIVPTAEHVIRYAEFFGKQSSTREAVRKILKKNDMAFFETPRIYVGTPGILALVPDTIGLVILDGESDESYKEKYGLRYDTRTIVRSFAKTAGIPLIVGDTLLATEIHGENLTKKHAFVSWNHAPKPFSIISPTGSDTKSLFISSQIFSEPFTKTLKRSLDKKEKIALFAIRKGIASSIICSDCGALASCPDCGLPFSLKEKKKTSERILVCSRGHIYAPYDFCKICGGPRMSLYGITTDKIEEEIKRLFPETTVYTLDSEKVSSSRQARTLCELWRNDPNGILVTNTKGLPFLETNEIDMMGIVSLDTLLSLPALSLYEKIARLVMMLGEKSRNGIIMQTRVPELFLEQAFLSAKNLKQFIADEIASRKMLSYPPFKRYTKLSYRGKNSDEAAIRDTVMQKFFSCGEKISAGSVRLDQSHTLWYGIIAIPADTWPQESHDKSLAQFLESLPPSWEIDPNPDSFV